MNASDTFAVPEHVMARQVGDETVILDLASGVYFGLDPVGAQIWQLLSRGTSLHGIAQVLLDKYEVTAAQLESDVVRLAQQLQQRRLISPA